MHIALAQINTKVGDLAYNAQKITSFARLAAEKGADLVVFPELSVTGYPAQDLLTYDAFIRDVAATVERIARQVPLGLGLLVGAPTRNGSGHGKGLFNSALLLCDGSVQNVSHKSLLPTYDVYDEARYFQPAFDRRCVTWRGRRLGVLVCEDMWNVDEQNEGRLYDVNPLDDLADADLFIALSATPFSHGIADRRREAARSVCRRYGRPLVIVNQVGGTGELVFDGDSAVYLPNGRLGAHSRRFNEELVFWDDESGHAIEQEGLVGEIELVHEALVLGLRDYVVKSNHEDGVLVGLSGGIDSAVTCALATHALGSERVHAVYMPSVFSSDASRNDAHDVADGLGVQLDERPIESICDSLREVLSDWTSISGVDENLQARVRGVLLMALSNATKRIVLAAGNKSELATGYSTLYGDTVGALCPLGDLYKSDVYRLASHINARAGRDVIPVSVLRKAPSAELRPGQKDSDDLPTYDILDAVLTRYVERRLDADAIAETTGLAREEIRAILERIDRYEFKRRQSAPVLRVSRKAFGFDRQMPIINGYTPLTRTSIRA